MKKVVKYQAEDSSREFDTEADCLAFEATQRIGKAINEMGAIHPRLDEEDLEHLFYCLKTRCKEDVAFLLGLTVNDQDEPQEVHSA